MPPSAKELHNRLTGRATETEEVIRQRMLRAVEESEGIDTYDYIVVNDKLEDCIAQINTIVNAARHTPSQNIEFIGEIRKRTQRVPWKQIKERKRKMIHPSYTELMKVVNSEVEPGEVPVVNSRYSIVMATSKRARQIIAGEEPLVPAKGKKTIIHCG